MPMPYLESEDMSVEMVNTFGGYNHNISIADGEFYDMQNMTCDDYPLAATREHRGTLPALPGNCVPLDMCGKDKMMVEYQLSGTFECTVEEAVTARPTISVSDEKVYIAGRLPLEGKYQYISYSPHSPESGRDFGNAFHRYTDNNLTKIAYVPDDHTQVSKSQFFYASASSEDNVYIPNYKYEVRAGNKFGIQIHSTSYPETDTIAYSGNVFIPIGTLRSTTRSGNYFIINYKPKFVSDENNTTIAEKYLRIILATSEHVDSFAAFTYVSGSNNSVVVTPSASVSKNALAGRLIKVTTGDTVQTLEVKSNTAGGTSTDITIVFTENLTAATASGTTVAMGEDAITGNGKMLCFADESSVSTQIDPIDAPFPFVDLTLTHTSSDINDWSETIKMQVSGRTDGKTGPQYDYSAAGQTIYLSIGHISGTYYRMNTAEYVGTEVSIDESFPAYTDVSGKSFTIGSNTYTVHHVDGDKLYINRPHAALSADDEISISLGTGTSSNVFIADYDATTGSLSHATSIGTIASGKRQIIEMGAQMICLPERQIVNTAVIEDGGTYEVKPMDRVVTARTADSGSEGSKDVCFFCDINKNVVTGIISDTAPSNPTNGTVWFDNSEATWKCKRYSESLGTWANVAVYMYIHSGNYSYDTYITDFDSYDALQITWNETLSKYIKEQEQYIVYDHGVYDTTETVEFPYKSTTSSGRVYYTNPKGKHWYMINVELIGFAKSSSQGGHEYDLGGTVFSAVTPNFDYMLECDNRLWACRYGEDINGEFVNEIFCTRLGDPRNWRYFANTSMDSFYVSLGDDGKFTGCGKFNNQPVFFRKDRIHYIGGKYPAQYQLETIDGYGCADGSWKSIVNMNNICYYLSPVGMCAWSGGVPVSFAEPFGDIKYKNGVAGCVGNKYYISMHDENNNAHLFVYDDNKAMWHKEDNLDVSTFFEYESECYAFTEAHAIIATGGELGTAESDFDFCLQTGDIGYGSPYKKYISKLTLRLKLDLGNKARIDIQYDNDGTWHRVSEIRPTGKITTIAAPIYPTRCDHFAIRITGHGNMKLLGVTKFYTEGSDE